MPAQRVPEQHVSAIHAIAAENCLPISRGEIEATLRAHDDADLVTAWVGGKMAACQLMQMNKLPTPFGSEPLHVLYFGLSFTSRTVPLGVAAELTRRWTLERLGLKRWLFQPTVGVAITPNPRVIDAMSGFFPTFYPNASAKTPKDIVQFTQAYLGRFRGLDITLKEDLSFEYPHAAVADVTDAWEKRFRSRSDATNGLLFDSRVLERRSSRIWMTGRMMACVCFRSSLAHAREQSRSQRNLQGSVARQPAAE